MNAGASFDDATARARKTARHCQQLDDVVFTDTRGCDKSADNTRNSATSVRWAGHAVGEGSDGSTAAVRE